MKDTSNTMMWVLTAVALASTALVVSCGGSSGGGEAAAPSGTSTTAVIDMASATAAIPAFAAIVPVCSPVVVTAAAVAPVMASAAVVSPSIVLPLMSQAALLVPTPSATASSIQPADKLGSCGGRITYSTYSHLHGVTTATRLFDAYCTSDPATGERQITTGSFDFVNTGTPSASGPITSKISASSVGGLALVRQDVAGKVISSQVLAFNNFLYTVGVPGGKPTATSPSSYAFDEFTVTDTLSNKAYRGSGYSMVFSETPTGGQQYTVNGHGYRSNGDSFGVNTTTPIVSDAFGSSVSGVITFTGANNTVAVATFVPGLVNQVTMTINGVPVTGQPACR